MEGGKDDMRKQCGKCLYVSIYYQLSSNTDLEERDYLINRATKGLGLQFNGAGTEIANRSSRQRDLGFEFKGTQEQADKMLTKLKANLAKLEFKTKVEID